MKLTERHIYIVLFSLVGIVHFLGLFPNIMGLDACQYAEISREMVESGNYLEIYCKGNDYLDKPPLHFWLSAFSFKIFGFENWAYRLPSYLFTILGAFSTYKLGSLLYDKRIGRMASLFFYSSMAVFMITVDVRTDTMLTGAIIFATWQLIEFRINGTTSSFFLGSIGVALAMLTKGPMGLMIPVLAIGSDIVLKRDWKGILKWQWPAGLALSIALISPMIYGLYTQWDLHPEKWMWLSDHQNVSGVKFFFWDQSFGRLTGDNPFVNHMEKTIGKQNNDYFFFIHTLAWAILPWTFAGFAGVGKKIFRVFKSKFKLNNTEEGYTVGSIILPIFALSLSAYKLPHYIFICIPFISILGAKYFIETKTTWLKWSHACVNIIIGVVAPILILKMDSHLPVVFVILLAIPAVLGILGLFYFRKLRIVFYSAIAMVCINLVFNTYFYPWFAKYDSGYTAAMIHKNNNQKDLLAFDPIDDGKWPVDSYAYHYYGQGITNYIVHTDSLQPFVGSGQYTYVDAEGLRVIQENGWDQDVIELDHFPITHLNIKFLNEKTRKDYTHKRYMVKI